LTDANGLAFSFSSSFCEAKSEEFLFWEKSPPVVALIAVGLIILASKGGLSVRIVSPPKAGDFVFYLTSNTPYLAG
jgi:hypothetical protein